MNIMCIGHATYDITVLLEQFIKENTKIKFQNVIECGGGSACNAAFLLGKWGMNVSFIGMVGNDENGLKIKKELESVHVNTNYLKIDDKIKTTTSFIMANKETGSRTILSYNLNSKQMGKINIETKPDIILTDGQEYDLSLSLINNNKDAISIMDADIFNEQNFRLAKQVDFVICSHEFAASIANEEINNNNLERIYLKLKQYFNNVVITLEDKGCLYEYNGQIKIMPSMNVKVVDTTGAGDIFHGAFVYAIANNYNYEDAILFSNIAASLSVTKIGGRNSIFDIEVVKEKYNEYR